MQREANQTFWITYRITDSLKLVFTLGEGCPLEASQMSVDTFAKGALFYVGLFWDSVNKVFLREMKVKLGKCAAAQFSVLF